MLKSLLLLAPLLLGADWGKAVNLEVGDRAPPWVLPNMLGDTISSKSYEGRPAVLVIGTAQEAAPPCRDWTITLHKNLEGTPAVVYQVVVLNNPWYIPEFAVIAKLEEFIPEFGRPFVALEWKHGWGDLYGITYDLETRLMVIDKQGIIRYRRTGAMTDEALVEVLDLVAKLSG